MTEVASLLRQLEDRIAAFDRDDDRTAILDTQPLADALIIDARGPTGARPLPPDVMNTLIRLHVRRSRATEEPRSTLEAHAAVALLAALAPLEPGAVPDELRPLAAPDTLPDFPTGWPAEQRRELHEATLAVDYPEALARLIDLMCKAIAAVPAEHPDRVEFQYLLGVALRTRYLRYGVEPDLAAAIHSFRDAARKPDGFPVLAERLSALAVPIRDRYDRTGSLDDLEEVIALLGEALRITPDDAFDRWTYLGNLGVALGQRSRHTGQAEDADQAVDALREAVRITPRNSTGLPARLASLGIELTSRFRLRGRSEDLDEAIRVLRDGVDLIPHGHPERARNLYELASSLTIRFHRIGQTTDLDGAVDTLTEAATLLPDGHPYRPNVLSGLGGARLERFQLTKQAGDLDEAVRVLSEAARTDAQSGPHVAATLSNLGHALSVRYEDTESMPDLDEAIRVHRRAARSTPAGHVSRPAMLLNLGSAMHRRYTVSAQPDDLESSIGWFRETIGASPDGHPDLAMALTNLGTALLSRFELFRLRGDAQRAVRCYRDAHAIVAATPAVRLNAAALWGTTAEKVRGDHAAAFPGLAAAIELLPRVSWRGADIATRERLLARWQGLTGAAAGAAIAAGHPDQAVVLLETGRGVRWAQLLETRTDLARLHGVAPELASTLERVGAELDRAGSARPGAEDGDRRVELAGEWDRLTLRVRELAGFESFLARPSYSHLRAAAKDGPVVLVNLSPGRCDALVIDRHAPAPRLVELPELSLADATTRADRYVARLREFEQRPADRAAHAELQRDIAETLRWLWRAVARPVLTELGLTEPIVDGQPWPRMWWCPTGPLAVLPLHAAGDPTGGTVLDRVVSSYTPTVGALVRAVTAARPPATARRLLVVNLPETMGQAPTPGATRTRNLLAGLFPGGLHTLLDAEAATRKAVTAELGRHSWVHFDCHGEQDLDDPSSGGLILRDGILSVADVSAAPHTHGEFAFLGACKTAAGSARLPDEAITLTAGLQFAGYRHVVGTLWSVMDSAAARVARQVYAELTRSGEFAPDGTATALHHAVRQLRDRHPDSPGVWAQFLHVGP